MGNPEDKNGGYKSGGEAQREQEARAEGAEAAKAKVAELAEKTQAAFKDAIGKIEDLALLGLAKEYLTGVANITKDNLGAFMKSFVTKNEITDSKASALELIKTINACLFLDDKHCDRVTEMIILLSKRKTELQVQQATNN